MAPRQDDDISTNLDRRQFVRTTGLTAAGLAGLAAMSEGCAKSATAPVPATEEIIQPGATILFQGDSITDGKRDRETAGEANIQSAMGSGYAWLAAAQLLVNPLHSNLAIFNRGISGHKVFQLADRWQEDCLDLRPDVLSILIGVNDIWHKFKSRYDGTVEIYETDYHALLQRTREALPEVKLIVCEPFVLKTGAVDDTWFPEFDTYRAAARRVADQAGATFVPFQTMFDRAVEYAPPSHWAEDGVHPTSNGADLMAGEWLRAVGA